MTPSQEYRTNSDSGSGWLEREAGFGRVSLHHRKGPGGVWYTFCPRPGFATKGAAVVFAFGAGWDALETEEGRLAVPSGAAHYLEHVLFKRDGEDLSDRFAAMGAYVNAFTSYDRVAFHFETPFDFFGPLEELLRLALEDGFTAEDVETERGIILSELLMEREDPYEAHALLLRRALFGECNLGGSILGTPESVRGMRLEDLSRIHRAVSAPPMVHVVAAGDLDREELAGRLDELTAGAASRSARRARKEKREAERPEFDEITAQGRVVRPMTSTAWRFRIPPPREGRKRAALLLAARLGAEALFSRMSRFYSEAVDSGLADDTLSYSVGAHGETGTFTIFAQTPSPERFRDFLLSRLAEPGFVEKGIEEHFARVRRKTEGGYHLSASSVPALLEMLMFSTDRSFPPPLNTEILPQLEAEDAAKAVRTALGGEGPVRVTTRPAP